MKHTPEPWIAAELGVISNTLTSHGNFYICSLIDPENEEDKANARRIVACVNACEGIGTEILEALPLNFKEHAIEFERLQTQNARLLEALKRLIYYHENEEKIGREYLSFSLYTANAAIAEAEAAECGLLRLFKKVHKIASKISPKP